MTKLDLEKMAAEAICPANHTPTSPTEKVMHRVLVEFGRAVESALAREQQEQIKVLREAISDLLLVQSSSAHKQCDDGLIAMLPSAIRKARAALAATEEK